MNRNSIEILFEDDWLVVVNKPAGMVVNRAETVHGSTIQDWMEERYLLGTLEYEGVDAEIVDVFKKRHGLGHRLDKDTSGVLVLAKEPQALQFVMREFKERRVEKEYLALVHGRLEPAAGFVRLPIIRSSVDRQMFQVAPFGKMAFTEYAVEKHYSNHVKGGYERGFSLVHCFPKTGRTHQIRVHLKHLGHPIVGDQLYAGRKRSTRDNAWCPRQFLHAHRIRIRHPYTLKPIDIKADLSADLKNCLKMVK